MKRRYRVSGDIVFSGHFIDFEVENIHEEEIKHHLRFGGISFEDCNIDDVEIDNLEIREIVQ